MAQVTEYGYETLRNFIETSWKYIELQDEAGTPIIRLGIGDSRVNWKHLDGEQTLKLEIKITGADVTLPQTFEKSAIFDVASGGTAISVEAFTAFTMEGATDELTVVHSIQVPQVV